MGQPEAFALPFELAHKTPEMTVIAAQACETSLKMTVAEDAESFQVPPNLLLARGDTYSSVGSLLGIDDEIASLPAAWKAAGDASSVEAFRKGGCDWLLLSEGALEYLAISTLPSVAQTLLGRALLWCDAAILPADFDVGGYWKYVGQSTGLMRAALASVARSSTSILDVAYAPAAGLLHVKCVRDQSSRHRPMALEAIRLLGITPHDAMRGLGRALEQRGFDGTRTREALACVFAGIGNSDNGALGFYAGHIDPFISCSLANRRAHTAQNLSDLGAKLFEILHTRTPMLGISFESIVQISKYKFSRSQESQTGTLFAETAADEMRALQSWWPSMKAVLDPMRSACIGITLVGNDLGMVAIKAARFAPAATVINWRDDATERLLAIADLSRILASRRVFVGRGPTKISRLRTLAGTSGSTVVAIGASMIVQWLAATRYDSCDTVALEAKVGAAIDIGQQSVLIELPRLGALAAGLRELVPTCAVVLDLAYAGNEVTLLRAALSHVARPVAYVEVSAAGIGIPRAQAQLVPVELSLLFRIEFDAPQGRAPLPIGLSIAAAMLIELLPTEKAALLRAHLQLPLDRLNSSMFVQAPDLLATSRLSLTITEGSPVLFVREGVSAFLWPIIPAEPWISPRGHEVWDELQRDLHASPAEHRGGRFSLIEFGCREYSMVLQAASTYPNATVLSIAGASSLLGNALYSATNERKLRNVLCCAGQPLDGALAKKLYDSPELSRFALLQSPSLLDALAADYGEFTLSASRLDLKKSLGHYISCSLTTWLPFPTIKHVSLAMLAFFPETVSADALNNTPTFLIDTHPVPAFWRLLQDLMEHYAIVPPNGQTRVVAREGNVAPERSFSFPLIRIDLVEMTRRVHHHFDWAKDGHKRTYTMHVDLNDSLIVPKTGTTLLPGSWNDPASGGGELVWRIGTAYSRQTLPLGHHVSDGRVLHVRLVRDQDSGYIPYGIIHAFTLICALRLGLVDAQVSAIYSEFIKLPLYEDMAPWNIALAAGAVEYIDYDTRGKVYDTYVRETYRVLSVLMNYKRTVSDFGMCGESAQNPYGFGQVSSCVKPKTFDGKCEHSEAPVPCDDGNCHSDYISCLRALANKSDGFHQAEPQSSSLELRSLVGSFDLRHR